MEEIDDGVEREGDEVHVSRREHQLAALVEQGQAELRLREDEADAMATALGVPVSTTHTITGAIVGVGSVRHASAVRWGVAGTIVWAWILTIPASAFVAAVAYAVSLILY